MGDPETCKPVLIQTQGKCKEESQSTSFPPTCHQHIWNPSNSNFEPYLSVTASHSRQVNNHQRIVVKLTKDVVDTYHNCDQSFIYSEVSNPLCYLTKPFFPTSNGGFDNENSDLILSVNAVLSNEETGYRYIIKALLGQGTFGQVAKCWSDEWNTFVAVKVIKNQRAYYLQATVEIAMLKRLNTEFDPEDKHHIVRMLDCFIHQQHLCIVFELLGYDLFELLKINKYKGISLNLVRDFCVQILSALEVLSDASIIHCDLKPENIMLTTCLTSPKLKVIDFGSSCMENRPTYSYIQSRSYRSPEVILGHKYTTAIDIWSFGCIAAELFLGVPLFPAKSEYDLLQRMIMILGDTPPEDILCNAKKSEKYFKLMKVPTQCNKFSGNRFVFQFLTQEEYDSVNQKKAILGKHYFFADWNLEQIIMNYPMKKLKSIEEIDKENNERLVFIDFLKGLLNLDPVKRWTASEIRAHPFITNEPFTGSYQPSRQAQKMPVYQGIMVDHNPDLGHWSAVGLSPPQMGANSNAFIHTDSPQVFLGSSYSSAESLGDVSNRLESSPWVYANSVGLYSKHQSPSSFGNEWSGYSPLQRMGHFLQLNICLAGSPIAGSFTPVSLGASPLNLAHAYSHLSPGSSSLITSPSRQGPISPARISNGSATALGKAAVISQFNKRMGLGSPVSVIDRNSSTSSSYVESSLQGLNLGSPGSPTQHASQFGRQTSVGRQRIGDFMNYPLGSLGALLSKLESNSSTGEDNLLQPGYGEGELSEELLFEDDATELMSAGGPSASRRSIGPENHTPQ